MHETYVNNTYGDGAKNLSAPSIFSFSSENSRILGHVGLNQLKLKICLHDGNEPEDIVSPPLELHSQKEGRRFDSQDVCVCMCAGFYDILGHFYDNTPSISGHL